ncbi:MAG TPA: helix-turn-helix transcriptional regulator [Micromonosporaceae bacterium]
MHDEVGRADGGVAHRQRVAAELKRLRELAGESSPSVAAALGEGWSQSKVSRIENGRIGVSVRDLAALLSFYGAPEDVKAELLTMTAEDLGHDGAWVVRGGGTPRRQGEVAAIETRVWRLRQYHPLMVPGLLQSPQYAEAIARLGGFDDPAGIVSRRMARQRALVGRGAPEYMAVLDARAFGYRPGDQGLMREQIIYVCERANLPEVTLRVIPLGVEGVATAMVPFLLYDFRAEMSPPVVMIETQSADLYLSSTTDVGLYTDLFERLTQRALDHDASVDYLMSLTDHA